MPWHTLGQKDLDSIIDAAIIKVYENPKKAIEIGNNAFEKASLANTKVSALMLISVGYLSQRENAKALEYALMSKDYLGDVSDVKTTIRILNAIGMQHQQLRIYDKAIEYLNEAWEIIKLQPNKEAFSTELAYNYAIRGFIYRERMNCDIALSYFNRSIDQYKKRLAHSSSSANISTMMYNKGNCFLQLNHIDSARTNFVKAIEYAEKINANSLYAFAKKGLSEVYTLNREYKNAIRELKDAENASKEIGDLLLNQGIYKNLSDNYLAINDKRSYQGYFEKSIEIQKEIISKEEKSIDGSIINLIEEMHEQSDKELGKLKLFQWILIALIGLITLIFGRIVFRKHQILKIFKEKLASFEE